MATAPDKSATPFSHSPKPSGRSAGAMRAPILPKIESAASGTMRRFGANDCRNHTAMLMTKMIVPARVKKSLARSPNLLSTLRAVGTR